MRGLTPARVADIAAAIPTRRFLLLVVVIQLLVGFALGYAWGFRASDDNIWLYFTGAKLMRPQAAAAEQQLIDALEASRYPPEWLARMAMRQRYERNYIGASVAYRSAGALVRASDRSLFEGQYPTYVWFAVLTGFAALQLLVVLTLVLILRRVHSGENLMALALALGLLVVTAQEVQPNFILVGGALASAKQVAEFVFNPGVQYSLFGSTPRNNFAVLILAVFALRWAGRAPWAYLLLPPLALLHQSHATFALAFLLAVDLAWQPKRLLEWQSVLVILLFIILSVSRETLWTYVGSWGIWLGVAAGGLAVLISWLWRRNTSLLPPGTRGSLGPRSRSWFGKVQSNPVLSDLVAMVVLVLIALLISVLAKDMVQPLQYQYFWGQLPTRALSFLQVPIVWAVFVLTLRAIARRFGERRRAILSVAVLMLFVGLSVLFAVRQDYDRIPQARDTLRQIDAELSHFSGYSRSPETSERNEAMMYFALCQVADKSANLMQRLFPSQPRSPLPGHE